MKVTLINYTGMGLPEDHPGHAINQLLFTKATRLTMSPALLDEICAWPKSKKAEELKYMANTIPSSWEFVDYTFMVEEVTRAFTHQLVRTRHGSYAQQTMRVLDVSEGDGWTYGTGPSIPHKDDPAPSLTAAAIDRQCVYHGMMQTIGEAYKHLIAKGAKIEDARGILPTNIHTNIVAKFNMRTLVELVRKRSSPRTQGEYRTFLYEMVMCVLEVHPWIDLFINRSADQAARELDAKIEAMFSDGKMSPEQKIEMMKLVDLMRSA